MNTHPLRFRASDLKDFDAVRSGAKTVETRAATPKYRKIIAGDSLKLICGTEHLNKRVTHVEWFKSLNDLFAAIPWESIMPNVADEASAKKVFDGYSGYAEKIAQYGIMAFTMDQTPRGRSGVLIERDGSFLLIRRENTRGIYYVTPGGGIEEGETPEEAAIREMQEEAGVEITGLHQVWKSENPTVNQVQYFFTAKLADPKVEPTWQETHKQTPGNSFAFEWIPKEKIGEINLLPKELIEHLAA